LSLPDRQAFFMVETAEQRTNRLRRLRANNPGYSTAKNKAWKDANREKYLAHKAVENALKTGKLIRQACECGCDRKAQAHHEDYSKPLDVRWLCVQAHKARHIEIDRESATA
jgi:hypothetical protein